MPDKSLLYGASLFPDAYLLEFNGGTYPERRINQKEWDASSLENPYWYIKNAGEKVSLWDLAYHQEGDYRKPLLQQTTSATGTEARPCMVCLQGDRNVIKSTDILGVAKEKFYYRIASHTPDNGIVSAAFGFCGGMMYSYPPGSSNTPYFEQIVEYDSIVFPTLPGLANEYSATDRLLPFIQLTSPTAKLVIDYVIIVSLSKVFGLGNEPDIAWCHQNINYDSLYVKEEKKDAKT